jgi:hypothetical protein
MKKASFFCQAVRLRPGKTRWQAADQALGMMVIPLNCRSAGVQYALADPRMPPLLFLAGAAGFSSGRERHSAMRLSLVLLLLLLASEPTDTLLARTRGPACLVSADDALQSCDCDWTQGGDNCHIEDDGSRCFCMCCCPHMSTGFQCGWHQRARVHQSCSSGGGSLPMVYLLGSQKSGTTSLIVDMMVSMPALLAPVIPDGRKGIDPEHYSKELHFFDNSERFAGGAKLLTSYFPRCDELKRTGRVPVEVRSAPSLPPPPSAKALSSL